MADNKLILPDDPDFNKPITWGDPFEKGLTPKSATEKRNKEFDAEREKQGSTFKYANSAIAFAPDAWMKNAQMTGVSNMMTQPMWFSPLHTPQNWQIASKRREIYQWCHLPGALVTMSDGSQKPIEQVIPGDFVISHTGKIRKVLAAGIRAIDEDIYNIHVSGLSSSLNITGNHKLFACKQECLESAANVIPSRIGHFSPHKYREHIESQHDWIRTDELGIGDLLFTPTINIPTKLTNSAIEWTENLCELLGAYAAEGDVRWYSYKKNKVRPKGLRFTVGKHEVIFQNRIYKLLKSVFDVEPKIYTGKTAIDISAFGVHFSDFFLKHVGEGCYTKKLSNELKTLPKQYIQAFLRGYFSGDGCAQKDDGRITSGTSSNLLDQDIKFLLMRLSIPFRCWNKVEISGNTHYVIESQPIPCLNNNVYKCSNIEQNEGYIRDIQNGVIQREYKTWFPTSINNSSFVARRIRKIDVSHYVGNVYNIEVEEDHSYIVNYVAVSNCRFFYENEPKVAAAIDFYSRFPMNGFKLECTSEKVLRWYKHHVVKRLDLNEKFKMISSEYFMLGDVFVHTDVECEKCHGSGVDMELGEKCNHPNGNFKDLKILNPDWMEVQQSILANEPSIVMVPDEELKRIVFYRQPKNIYDSIPDAVKKLVIQNKPIPMSNRTISHIKHMPVPYGAYGSSLIRRLFTTLAYKTKIMTANWIVAERLIIPVRVIKIGSDNRPATSVDIADVQQQIAQTTNDPNLTIVTHHNFEYEWYGASGKILQVTQEMEWIGKEILDGFMLNQSLLNGEMCYSYDTEVLTDDGFKKYDEVKEKDLILTYSLSTKRLSYEKPEALHVYDYDGDLIHFSGDQVDIMVTPNHRMLTRTRKDDSWEVVFADKVTPGMRFLAHANYESCSVKHNPILEFGDFKIDSRRFFEFAGYYLSEGSMSCKKSNYQVSVSQSSKSGAIDRISSCFEHLGLKYSDYYYKSNIHSFTICNKKFVEFVKSEFGTHADNKAIPSWIKNAPTEYLEIILHALIDGDGQTIHHTNTVNYVYTTISEQLANDVQEIAFKAGYNVRKVMHIDSSKDVDSKSRYLFRVKLSRGEWSKGNEPRINREHINKEAYKGKVWCYTVPNGFFVTRRNGKITIQGNSGYQSAQVGVETLIRRIESWRGTLAEWVQERVFKPIAEMQGFIDKKESEEIGETIYLYPTIKWNDLNLKDKNQWYQLLNQLHDKQLISSQTLLEELDLDYDQEIKRMRYETAQAGPAGAPMGGGMGAGGMGAGGMGAGPEGAGGAPGEGGMAGGAGGAAGGMGAPGMDGGMGGGMGAAPGMGMAASGGKVMKAGKQNKQQQEIEPGMMPMIKLTSIEQKMAKMLVEVAGLYKMHPAKVRAQYPVQNPTGGPPYQIDFALPELKIAVEADGEVWHENPEQAQDDKERDNMLAQRGWTVLRFDDKAIEDAPQAVQNTIGSYIKKKLSGTKEASTGGNVLQLFTIRKGEISQVDDFDDYVKIIMGHYPYVE